MTDTILAAVCGGLLVGWGAYAIQAEYRIRRLKLSLTKIGDVVVTARQRRAAGAVAVEDDVVRLRLKELMKDQAEPRWANLAEKEIYRRFLFGAYFTKWPRSSLRQVRGLIAEVLDGPE